MLKIGYITSSLSSKDGWGRYSKSLIEAVSKYAEVKAVITDATTGNETFVSPVYAKLPHFSYKPITQIKFLYYSLKYFRGCDIIHSLVETSALAAALTSQILGARLIMTLHGAGAVPPEKFSLPRLALKFACRTAAITTTGSVFTEKKVREKVNFGECRFIPNGVDPKIFHILPDASDKNFLLTVGWLKPHKGMDIVIKALIILKGEFPDLGLRIVGITKDRAFYDYLKITAKQGGVEDRVQFLGRVTDEELVRLYNNCSIFVFPARDIGSGFEGFPMVFYEANACGAPVITTRGFGSEYAIKDGKNGFLVDSDNAMAVAQAIKKILTNCDLHQRMKEGAIEEARNHNWDKIAGNQLMKMYNDALKK